MGELSCGFSDNVCFFTNDEIFEVASDGCPYIFAVNSKKYIELKEEEKETIYSIFSSYGGYFPCV